MANARQVQLISAEQPEERSAGRATAGAAGASGSGVVAADPAPRASKRKQHLMKIRVRAALVEARTSLVNAARGLTKAMGERLPTCDADAMGVEQMEGLPAGLQETLKPLLEQVESLTEKIKDCDRELEQIARTEYPETELLQQVSGVGTLIALTFVLTVEDRERFQKSRDVGCYVGLRPSGASRGRASRNCGSPRKATSICGSCWCRERTVF